MKTNFAEFEKMVHGNMQQICANALNNLAFKARKDVQEEMKRVFRDPEPYTLKSVRVQMADAALPVCDQVAKVYISEDGPIEGISPRKYLLTEEEGGERHSKRSERVLQRAGLIAGSQQFVPGPGAQLDAHGQLRGGAVTQLLSRLQAFGESGFRANASDKTKAGLRKKGLVARLGGTDYFIARKDDQAYAVFQLIGRGKIKPVLWITQAQSYRGRFHFRQVVAKSVAGNFKDAFASAVRFVGRKTG